MNNSTEIVSNKPKKIFQFIYVLLVIIALIYFFVKAYIDLKDQTFSIDYIFLIISFILYICAFIIMVAGWSVITKKVGVNISLKKTWKYWVYSQMGKYIPGKIWMVTSRAYMYKKENVLIRDISYLFILENLMAITSAGLFGVISLAFIKSSGSITWIVIASLMIITGVIFIKSNLIHFVLNKLLKIMKKGELREFNFSNFDLLSIFSVYIFQWLFIISAFYFFVTAFADIGIHQLFYVSTAITLAATLGLIAVFAPAGLGVREVTLVGILSNLMPYSLTIIISISFRVFATIVELIMFLITKLFIKD